MFVSGQGTTTKPGFSTPFFGRIKGETEVALASFRETHPTFHASSSRLGGVDPASHDAIKPYVPALPMWRNAAGLVLLPAMRVALAGMYTPTKPIGEFLVELAQGKRNDDVKGDGVEWLGKFPIIDNSAIRRIMNNWR